MHTSVGKEDAKEVSAEGGYDDAAAGQDPLMRYVELRRHTDNEGDRLTQQGAEEAEMIGRERLHPPYAAFVSTGAARATQMLEILRHAAGQDDTPITPATGLRSSAEDRWREAAKAAGRGADLDAIRVIDPELVERESLLLASALRQVVDRLSEGARALVVGHSPANEAAVLGLAGRVVPPLGKGEGVLLIEDGGDYRVEPLDLTAAGGNRQPPCAEVTRIWVPGGIRSKAGVSRNNLSAAFGTKASRTLKARLQRGPEHSVVLVTI